MAQTLESLKGGNRQQVALNTERPRTINDFGALLAKNMKQIGSVVASTVTPEKMARIALNELRANKYLMEIAINNPQSFVNAVMQASHLGLEIGGALGQAYLVPYKGEVKMMPGYRGLLSLSRRSGQVTSINAEIVYEKDTFDLELGIQIKVTHKPYLKGDRGEPLLAYMVAHFSDGGHHFEWMSISEINKVRDRSPSAKSGPWVTDYHQMVKKTVVRRGWKYLPMSIEMQNAEIIEYANDNGQGLVIDGDSLVVHEQAQQEAEQQRPAQTAPSKTESPALQSEEAYPEKSGFTADDIAAFELQEKQRLSSDKQQENHVGSRGSRGAGPGSYKVE